jgi:stage IV sporulation protein FB
LNKLTDLFKQIHIHPLLWLVMALSIMTGHFIELSIFLSIIFIHELGHGVAATIFSWRVKRISMLPFGGVAEVDEHGNRPLREEVIVTLAGPIQHIWMMAGAFVLHQLFWISDDFYQRFMDFNMMVLVFNLLPIWPLDGGKLIYLWRSKKESFSIAHQKTIFISCLSLIAFFICLMFIQPININLWVITSFLSFSLYYEWKQRHYVFVRFLLERFYGNKVEFKALRPIHVNEDQSVTAVLEQFQRGCKHLIIIEKDENETEQLDENELLHAYFVEKRHSAKMSELLYPY